VSPIQADPKSRGIARIALRRVAVPAVRPRVFPVFEEMYARALRGAEVVRAGGPQGARASPPGR